MSISLAWRSFFRRLVSWSPSIASFAGHFFQYILEQCFSWIYRLRWLLASLGWSLQMANSLGCGRRIYQRHYFHRLSWKFHLHITPKIRNLSYQWSYLTASAVANLPWDPYLWSGRSLSSGNGSFAWLRGAHFEAATSWSLPSCNDAFEWSSRYLPLYPCSPSLCLKRDPIWSGYSSVACLACKLRRCRGSWGSHLVWYSNLRLISPLDDAGIWIDERPWRFQMSYSSISQQRWLGNS